jgi:hypothetical protein
MKYLVVKGWLGFGDRMESLQMAVKFALDHKLQIYVDWRDSMWTHGDEDFYTYFKLVNIPVINSLSDIPEDATVYPPFWKDKLNQQLSNEFFNEHIKEDIHIGQLNKVYPADVIVSTLNYRTIYNDLSFFADVFRVIDPNVKDKLNQRKQKLPLANAWGIHIRGTDRTNSKNRDMAIQSIASHVTTMGGLNGVKMIAVSDDKDCLAIWKRFYPDTIVASELSISQTSLKGNHNLAKDSLSVSKYQMNVDMLTDFFTLASCSRIFSTFKSGRFFKEALRLSPHVDKMFSFQ